MLCGIWDYVFGLCVPLLFKSGAWGPCSPGLVAGDSFSVSRLLSSPFLFLFSFFFFFQRQSWIEKRGGTGCGLLAEGELNSHSLSLSPSLSLSLSRTFSFFQWRLKSIHSVDCWHSPAQRAQDLWLPLMGMLWTKALPSAQSCQPPVRPTPSLHLAFKDAGPPSSSSSRRPSSSSSSFFFSSSAPWWWRWWRRRRKHSRP